MRRTLCALAALALLTASLHGSAQAPAGFVTVSHTRLLNSKGLPVANADIYAQPVTTSGQPISALVGLNTSSGIITIQKTSVHTTGPGVWTMPMPDGSFSSPKNLCMQITAKDSGTQEQLLNGYSCVQPHSVPTGPDDWCQPSGCDFGRLKPLTPNNPVIVQGPPGVGIPGAPGCTLGNVGCSIRTLYTSAMAGLVVAPNGVLAGASAAGAFDNAPILQTAVNGGNVNLVIDTPLAKGAAIVLSSHTRVNCAAGGGLIQLPGANAELFVNAHPSAPTVPSGTGFGYKVSNLQDQDIEVGDGCMLNVNSTESITGSDHQFSGTTGKAIFGMRFLGVDGLKIRGEVHDAGSYAWTLSNVRNIDAQVRCTACRRDGFHVNGPALGGQVKGYFETGDDPVALNADDGGTEQRLNDPAYASTVYPGWGGGPIENFDIDIQLNNALTEGRMLSVTERIDNNRWKVHGTVKREFAWGHEYDASLGLGNFGHNSVDLDTQRSNPAGDPNLGFRPVKLYVAGNNDVVDGKLALINPTTQEGLFALVDGGVKTLNLDATVETPAGTPDFGSLINLAAPVGQQNIRLNWKDGTGKGYALCTANGLIADQTVFSGYNGPDRVLCPTYPVTTVSGLRQQQPPLPSATVYQSSFWKDFSALTAVGSPAITNGAIAFNTATQGSLNAQRVDLPFYSADDQYDQVAELTLGTFASGDCCGFALAHLGTGVPTAAGVYVSYNPGNATMYLASTLGSTPAVIASRTLSTPPAVGDRIRLTLSQRGNAFTAFADNDTQGTRDRIAARIPLLVGSSYQVPNMGIWSLVNLGGQFTVTNYSVVSQQPRNPDLCVVGDSKTAGYNSITLRQRWASNLSALGSVAVYAGAGDTTTSVLASVPYLVNQARCRTVVLVALPRNDVSGNVPAATWQANYLNIVIGFRQAGVAVIHMLPIPENMNQAAIKSYITTTFPGDKMIDVSPGWTAAYLSSDGTHPSIAGHGYIANAVVNSGVLPLAKSPVASTIPSPDAVFPNTYGGN